MEKITIEKLNNHATLKRILWISLSILFIVVIIAGIYLYRTHGFDSLKRFFTYRSLDISEDGTSAHFTYDGGKQQSIAILNNSLIISSTNGIRQYSLSGKQLGQEALFLSSPILEHSERYAVVYEAGNGSVSSFDASKLLYTIDLEPGYGIFSARVNNNGYLALTSQSKGYKGTVSVFTPGKSKLIDLNYSSAFVLDAIVSENNKSVSLITLGEGSGSYESTLVTYPVNEEEPIATIPLGNMVPLALAEDDNTLRILGENCLINCKNGTEISSEYIFSGALKGYDLNGNGFSALLLGPHVNGSANKVIMIDNDGNLIQEIGVTAQSASISASGNYLAVLTSSHLEIYTSDGNLYSTLDNIGDAKYVAVNHDGTATLMSSSEAWLYIPN